MEDIMKYKIVADAACDIPEEFMKKYDITFIPIEVRFGDELYPEGLETREFYKKLATSNVIPKTSMPNAYKFEDFYRPYVNKDDVFVITIVISMELSQTKIQAQMAAENLGMKNVFIEESGAATLAQGAIIIELCKFMEKENDIEKIKEEFYRLKRNVKLYAIINDLKYLKNSGRLSSASAVMGSLLNVKPIISIKDGKLINVAKCAGTGKAESYLINKVENVDSSRYFYIAHTDNLEGAQRLKEKVKDKLDPNQEIVIGEIGCVVGSHVGAKCYAIGFISNDSEN